MTTITSLTLRAYGRRIVYLVAGSMLIAIGFFGLPHLAIFTGQPATAAIVLSRPVAPRPGPGRTLPFTITDFVGYFSDALEETPKATNNRFVFAGPINGNADDTFRIAIYEEARDLVVAFGGGGDYGMTLAREFFEAPFFKRDETLRFFALLEECRTASASAKLRRFDVRFTHIEHSDDFHLMLRFSADVL